MYHSYRFAHLFPYTYLLIFLYSVFTCNLAYVVLRELDLLKHPNLSLRHLAQDGLLSKLRPFLNFILIKANKKFQNRPHSDLIFCFLSTGNNLEVVPGTCAEHLLSIEIDIATGPNSYLRERFEWDLTNPDNSPEEFAACLVADHLHSLGPEN